MKISRILGWFLLIGLAACGGGGGGTPAGSNGSSDATAATRLVYTNDSTATASDWRLEVDSASNGTGTILLRLLGPSGAAVKGATVFLSLDGARASWTRPAGAEDSYAAKGNGLDLTQAGGDASLQLFKSRLAANGLDLHVGAYQKSGSALLAADRPLFSLALGIKAGSAKGTVSLTPTAGRTAIFLDASGEHAITLKMGSISAQ